ncbi:MULTISPECIES: YafY family protein [unclassified Plantactinospora]|uniref:helix-turn-helix transcriptional regulator n=1 Tax=unclassified Plantactinospora TaxID=2631981 RepID=UPI000D15DB8B|nr:MULTISPECIES: YafY family protein [unclassified Plantactinospora]AVT31358.1 transcriptional regulator [Plantactinospora sp. BC1]AVT39893.1 transcriptional regulator [Plantactinospora sp. BB1]
MNRTDRLYALVEELRAVAPRPRSARWLADRFEVDARTIRRDIGALQESGVPIYPELGRGGGYVLDRAYTLPPVNITPREAIAAAVALETMADTPFLDAARSVLHKILAVMPPSGVEAVAELAGRIRLTALEPEPVAAPARQVLRTAGDALLSRTVLAIEYVDRNGAASQRLIEPVELLGAGRLWYLVGWCRLRQEVRGFRLDRMRRAAPTNETAPPRSIEPAWRGGLDVPATPLQLPGRADSSRKADRMLS